MIVLGGVAGFTMIGVAGAALVVVDGLILGPVGGAALVTVTGFAMIFVNGFVLRIVDCLVVDATVNLRAPASASASFSEEKRLGVDCQGDDHKEDGSDAKHFVTGNKNCKFK